jgi:hypothetical protein
MKDAAGGFLTATHATHSAGVKINFQQYREHEGFVR